MAAAFDRYVLGRAPEGGSADNLAPLRLAAAAAVLYAHSWPIALGPAALDPVTRALQRWFGEGVALSSLAVHAFFVISGYLVTKSAMTRGGLASFAAARVLRIYPALVASTLLCAFAVGPLVTTLPAGAYLTAPETWKFVVNNVFSWNVIYRLPGVFADHPLTAVNGSLWTLPLEIRCYVAIGLALACGLFRRVWLFSALALAVVIGDAAFRNVRLLGADAAATCLAYFLIGAVLYVNRRVAPTSPVAALALLVVSMALPDAVLARLAGMAGWACLVLWTGLAAPRIPWPETAIGDPSYGVYIYAFPIQQLALSLLGPLAPPQLAAIAGAATLVAAIVSWKALEAPMLAYKTALAAAWRGSRITTAAVAAHAPKGDT